MDLKKQQTDKGYVITMKMSKQDLVENDLMTSFSLNRLHQYELIRRGKFDNFVNNYLIANFYDKENEYALPGQQRPLYQIKGESDNFIEVTAFFPKNNITKSSDESPHPDGPTAERNFDHIYTNEEAFTEAEPGWQPNAEERMK